MSESTQRLLPELKTKYPDIDWRGLAGLRNVLVHGYLGLDLDQIWWIIQEDLEPLKNAVEAMLATLDANEDIQ